MGGHLKMKLSFLIFFSLFFLIYGGSNYYVGTWAWKNIFSYITGLNIKLYWIIFSFLPLSFMIEKIGNEKFPTSINSFLMWVGSYWLASLFYLFFLVSFVDILGIFNKWLGFNISFSPHGVTVSIIILVLLILIYGSWNSRNPILRHYDLKIPKHAGNLEKLHIVMASDVHLGHIMHKKRLEKMVQMINEQQPDIVFLVGDVVDSNTDLYLEKRFDDAFLKLKAKYGVYAALGNHEYISGFVEEHISNLEKSKVKVLRDSYEKIGEDFYVLGRDDKSSISFIGERRKDLAQLMQGIDNNLPVILLDHQPDNLEEARENGVDLQFSGHTHRGQLFPNHLITGAIYETDWGYLKKDNLHVIVSVGFGTWGPPIRLGNRPEIVDVMVEFTE